MGTINVKEARTHLSDLIRDAEHGCTTVITRYGKPVAQIAPVEQPQKRLPSLKEFRGSLPETKKSLTDTLLDMRRGERY